MRRLFSIILVIAILGGGAYAAYRLGLFNRKTERQIEGVIKKVEEAVETVKEKVD